MLTSRPVNSDERVKYGSGVFRVRVEYESGVFQFCGFRINRAGREHHISYYCLLQIKLTIDTQIILMHIKFSFFP